MNYGAAGKKWLWFFARLGITAALLALLLQAIDLQEFLRQAREVGLLPFAGSALSFLVATTLNTFRWHLLLNVQRPLVPFRQLLAYNFSYTFYTVALPGGRLAAEAMRIYQIVRDHEERELRGHAIASAFLDRIVAFLSFAAIVAVFFIVVPKATAAFSLWALVVAAVVIATAAFFAFGPPAFLLRPLQRFFPRGALAIFLDSSPSYRVAPLAWLGAAAFSLAADFAFALGAYGVALALGVSVPLFVVLAAFSIGMVAASVPLTIAGIGLREGAFAASLVALGGIPGESAAVISAVMLASSFSVVALGGLVELRRHFLP